MGAAVNLGIVFGPRSRKPGKPRAARIGRRVSFPLSAIYKILPCVTARLASTHTALVSSPQKPVLLFLSSHFYEDKNQNFSYNSSIDLIYVR